MDGEKGKRTALLCDAPSVNHVCSFLSVTIRPVVLMGMEHYSNTFFSPFTIYMPPLAGFCTRRPVRS